MKTYDLSLKALADPTRRRILDLLRTGSHNVNDIAAHLPISQPAVSQHLTVLKNAGLVSVATDGARRNYSLDDAGLIAVRAYIDSFWNDAIESFREVADELANEPANVAGGAGEGASEGADELSGPGVPQNRRRKA